MSFNYNRLKSIKNSIRSVSLLNVNSKAVGGNSDNNSNNNLAKNNKSESDNKRYNNIFKNKKVYNYNNIFKNKKINYYNFSAKIAKKSAETQKIIKKLETRIKVISQESRVQQQSKRQKNIKANNPHRKLKIREQRPSQNNISQIAYKVHR